MFFLIDWFSKKKKKLSVNELSDSWKLKAVDLIGLRKPNSPCDETQEGRPRPTNPTP